MRIAIVAGEASGDILGAGLIRSLKQKNPKIEFLGIGGELMIAEGFQSLFPLDRLSVMGIVEPLKRLPELLHIRKTVINTCLEKNVDLFVGIDSPDFNLGIEKRLKKKGIKTCHYVSPSVWAWRQGRIKGIKKSVDLMLTLLPFEADFYHQHQVPVAFVGHPLADQIAIETDQEAALSELSINHKGPVLAVLPGSREGEVKLLGELFLTVAKRIRAKYSDCLFVIPAANEYRYQQLKGMLDAFDESFQEQVHLVLRQSRTVMAAADAVLLASGTTALEAMLLKKPMVVAYKISPLSYAIVSRLMKSPYVSLPNLLAGMPLVAELLQDEATPASLEKSVLSVMEDEATRKSQIDAFKTLHKKIQCNADEKATEAVWTLLND